MLAIIAEFQKNTRFDIVVPNAWLIDKDKQNFQTRLYVIIDIFRGQWNGPRPLQQAKRFPRQKTNPPQYHKPILVTGWA